MRTAEIYPVDQVVLRIKDLGDFPVTINDGDETTGFVPVCRAGNFAPSL